MTSQNIAVFDFDGTLTTKDTLLEFIAYACGAWRLYVGLLLLLPLLVLMKLHLYSNSKAKERLFSFCFRGWSYADFKACGQRFAAKVDTFRRDDVCQLLQQHLQRGDRVYVVSASIEEWVRPWCELHGIHNVMGTQVETDADGRLTGRFSSKNCYGQEKVNRLLQAEPHRDTYYLYAYGDSSGDTAMLNFANKGQKV